MTEAVDYAVSAIVIAALMAFLLGQWRNLHFLGTIRSGMDHLP
jgi:uncharacterized PurR-regulated membrane protein YhhQ (DUF165 family)